MAARGKKAETKEAPVALPVVSYKGFNKDLQCRDFQFEIGKTYTVGGTIKACENGFHACEAPFDVWGYYAPGNSRFALVEQSGDIARHSDDTKIASAEITIKAELTLPDFIKRGVEWIIAQADFKNAKETNTGDQSAATNTGDRSAATNTGEEAVALASGYQGRVSGGKGCALFLVERDDDYKIVAVWAGVVGKDGIKSEVFYTLKNGKPVEWTET